MVIDPEHGTIDSPLHPDQVRIIPGVPRALADLAEAGFILAIVTNQPAWAKQKTTKANLDKVHHVVVKSLESAGARIASSHICFHKREDDCRCRKPRTGLLEDAIAQWGASRSKSEIWMVGDGVTDVQAGQALGIQTGFLAQHKSEALQILRNHGLLPTIWKESLVEFARCLLANPPRTLTS